jgi:DDE superfamily endonuclease
MNPTMLNVFRHDLTRCFLRWRDALTNVTDALLTQDTARSVPELSLSPLFLRRWPSLYAALQDGCVDRAALQRLFVRTLPRLASGDRLLLGGDTSSVPRPEAPTARDRTYLHVPASSASKTAITVGWQFSTLVVLPNPVSSWVWVLDNQRVTSRQPPTALLAQQLREVVHLLPERPVLVADCGYATTPSSRQRQTWTAISWFACQKQGALSQASASHRNARSTAQGWGPLRLR